MPHVAARRSQMEVLADGHQRNSIHQRWWSAGLRPAETCFIRTLPCNFKRNWLAPSLRDTVPRSRTAAVQERPAGPAKI
jgi:hypothetical protein